MPRLTPEKINEIRQSVDIVDVIGSYLSLEKKGRNYVALCPFHDDSRPSMSISPEKQIYMCFVCHNGGNVFSFLKDYLKISYIEAVKKVAEIGQVDLSEYHLEETKRPVNEKLQPLFKMHEEAAKIYSHYLNTRLGISAKEYLSSRKIDDDIITTFQIGFAPNENILVKAFEKLEFTKIDMYRSGLVIESSKGYDRFTNRIVFPLHNQDGRVVGFSGRIFGTSQGEAKYMNSPESEIFIKGDILYNYHRVKESVRKAGYVIVCEGFMDVIALYKAGIENAIAIMGTALTKGHMQAMHRLTKNIHLCLDGDSAGKAATIKCLDVLEQNGFTVKVIALPKDKDPDEVLEEHGQEELVAIFKTPISPIEFKMTYYYDMSNMANYEERKNYLETMIASISLIDDPIDRDYYVEQLVKKSGFSKDTITNLLHNKEQHIPKKIEPTFKQTKKLLSKYIKAERDLLYYMMEDRNVALRYEAQGGYMFNQIYKLIASYIVNYYRKQNILEVADFIDSIKYSDGIKDENIVQNIIDISQLELPSIKQISDDREVYNYQVIDDYIKIIKENTLRLHIEELNTALINTYDPKQKAKILEEIIVFEEKIRKLTEKE